MPSRRSSAPICPGSLHRSASARMRRFSLAENCRRRAIATTSGCAGAEREAASALALRAPFNATSRSADWGSGFTTDFIGLAMNCILSLYSNWSKAGVASHIGTQGLRDAGLGAVQAIHHELGEYWLHCEGEPETLFTENESNAQRLWGQPNASPFV